MKKIGSAEIERRKQKRNQLILGIILALVMFFSVIGYASQGATTNTKLIKYKGFEFIKQNNYWVLEKSGINFYFSSKPNELQDINTTLKPISNYVDEPLYIYSNDPEINTQIYLNFKKIATRIQPACLENQTCKGDFPIKNCTKNFIIIQESNETSIKQKQNCVYIKGEKQNLLKLIDIFLLKALGIKQ